MKLQQRPVRLLRRPVRMKSIKLQCLSCLRSLPLQKRAAGLPRPCLRPRWSRRRPGEARGEPRLRCQKTSNRCLCLCGPKSFLCVCLLPLRQVLQRLPGILPLQRRAIPSRHQERERWKPAVVFVIVVVVIGCSQSHPESRLKARERTGEARTNRGPDV